MYQSQFYFPDHRLANILEADSPGVFATVDSAANLSYPAVPGPIAGVTPGVGWRGAQYRAAMSEWSQFNTKSAKWVLLDL
jgi:hypothetical protein